MKKPPQVSPRNLSQTFSRAFRRLQNDPFMSSASDSVGLYMEPGPRGTREGVQVFVKVARFSEKLFKNRPLSGGLLENDMG